MTHADTLRKHAAGYTGLRGYEDLAAAAIAGAEAIDTLTKVREALDRLRGQQEAALQRWDDTGDTWDGATSDTLHDTIHLLTEALEGDNE